MTPEFFNRLLENSSIDCDLFDELLAHTDEHYRKYRIQQKNKIRQIEEPDPMLMLLQKSILRELQSIPLHVACMAKPGMSIRDNATMHAGAKHLLKLDIKGCYQSVSYAYTHMVGLMRKWLTPDLAEVLPTCFVKTKLGDHLPTGAPTSPALCNLTLYYIDEQISNLASQYGYQYTRYLDDLILSTRGDHREWDLLEKCKAELRDQGLTPHPQKCKWYSGGADRFIVTGVNIAGKISAPREIKRILRAKIYSLAKEGKEIDNVTRGYLAHVKDIDYRYYLFMMDYYKRKRAINVSAK